MKRFALAAVAAIAFAGTWTATANQTDSKPASANCKAKAFRAFTDAVWPLVRWERGAPEKATIRAQRRKLKCAPPRHRKKMQRRWRKAKTAYNKHRKAKYAARRARREEARYHSALTPPGLGVLEQIAACESGGDPGAISADGSYRGKYQFDYQTWASVGGSGDPAAAPEREQDERAAALYRKRGSQPWPVCGV